MSDTTTEMPQTDWASNGAPADAEPAAKKPYEIFPVSCPECGKALLWTSLRSHRLRQHGVESPPRLALEFYESIRFYGKWDKTRRKGGGKQRASRAKQPSQKPDPEAVSQRMLKGLFPAGIPVTKLKLVNAWVEATDQFVKDAGL